LRLIRYLGATLVLGALVSPGGATADIRLSRVSTGPLGGNGFENAQYAGPWGDNGSARWLDEALFSTNAWFMRTPLAEGRSAYFVTNEQLVPADTDGGLRDRPARHAG
jgi:hypothetical protein